jgi:hypothetical protein
MLWHGRLDEVGDDDGVAEAGAVPEFEASPGSLALWAPLLAGESLPAGVTLVEGVCARRVRAAGSEPPARPVTAAASSTPNRDQAVGALAGNALYWVFEPRVSTANRRPRADHDPRSGKLPARPDVLAQAPGQVGVGTYTKSGAVWCGPSWPSVGSDYGRLRADACAPRRSRNNGRIDKDGAA